MRSISSRFLKPIHPVRLFIKANSVDDLFHTQAGFKSPMKTLLQLYKLMTDQSMLKER